MTTSGISCAILAGGRSKRFGGVTKAGIVIDGERIISRIFPVIRDLFEEIIIVTDRPGDFKEFSGISLINDHFRKAGPLAGIHAALRSSQAGSVFVFASDMPFLDRRIIEKQIAEFSLGRRDILIPAIGSMIEPLHGIYSKAVLEKLEKYLSDGKNRSVRDFLACAATGYMQIEDTKDNRRAFVNINSPGDLNGLIS